ncbi:hypothetical protein NLI96_g12762 [Meripilus lineatus]|uniref:Uncharacterized protein n=1 Tax=Meripilus lineatus TaxID=2056292 RepID=A0AAD5UPB6_9APHY|nr:hypothetical protein NLI96_g12762 [Physisporinus lineatus]
MVDWKSPAQIAFDIDAFAKMVQFFIAIYFWEFLISLDFEYSFLKGTRKFNWPMIPYFCGRYSCILLCVSAITLVNSPTLKDCKTLYMVPSIGAVLSTTWASTNLAIRAMVMWSLSWWCVVPLCLLIAGQWAITLPLAIIIQATPNPQLGCIETHIFSRVLSIAHIYVIFADFAGLCFCAWRLSRGMKLKTQLSTFLFRDGMGFFVAVTLINVPAAVLSFTHTNTAVQAILVVPSGIVATIAASRAVRRLSNFRQHPGGPVIYATTTFERTRRPIEFRYQDAPRVSTNLQPISYRASPQHGGVHVQMDTFVSKDSSQAEAQSEKPQILTPSDIDNDS